MEEYKKIWSDVITFLNKKNKNFEINQEILSIKNELINNYFYVYTNLKNINFLEKFKSEINQEISEKLNKKVEVIFKTYFCELKDELDYETKNLIDKNNLKKFVINNRNKNIFNSLSKLISQENLNSVIYLFGNEGTGKTLLISTILKKYINTYKNKKVNYINIFDFSNKYYSCIKTNENLDDFISVFLEYDLLIFDDFSLIKGKEKLNEIIYEITNKSIHLNKKVIYISNIKENSFNLIDKKIQELIENGHIFKLNDPNEEDIKQIISKLIENDNKNLKITDESLNYLSSILGNNLSVVIDKMMKILFFFENPPTLKIIDLKTLKKILEKISFFKKRKNLSNFQNNQQLKFICETLNFNLKEILGKSRKKEIVFNRNIVIYLLKKKLNFSHEYIAKILSKDHSTITHSIKNMDLKMNEKSFKNYFFSLSEKIF